MFINAYQQIRERMDLKVQTAAFSILSLLYFVLYTVVSIILGNIVNDVATVIGFWMLNLVSTYVYMRFFFRILAAMRKEETVIYFRACCLALRSSTTMLSCGSSIFTRSSGSSPMSMCSSARHFSCSAFMRCIGATARWGRSYPVRCATCLPHGKACSQPVRCSSFSTVYCTSARWAWISPCRSSSRMWRS